MTKNWRELTQDQKAQLVAWIWSEDWVKRKDRFQELYEGVPPLKEFSEEDLDEELEQMFWNNTPDQEEKLLREVYKDLGF